MSFSSSVEPSVATYNSLTSENYEKFFQDSLTEEFIQQSPGCPGSSNPCFDSMRDKNGPESQRLGQVEYDESEIRLKLQELERALLEDEDEDDANMLDAADETVEAGGSECSGTTGNLSSSSDSSNRGSFTKSNKELSEALVSELNPKEMLIDCASALAEGDKEKASNLINELRQMVSIQGDPPQRIAAYMTEGLAARVEASGKFLYKALKCKEPPSLDRLAAMQILFEVCPCFKFGFMAANNAIIEAFEGENTVHIIDFDINQGSQYITLIQSIGKLPRKSRPRLRLTGVDDPESVQRNVGGLGMIGLRLEKLAEFVEVMFEFEAVPSQISNITPSMLDCRPGEAVIVNFAFQLHHMPDESVSVTNQRDQLLRMVKGLNPKLVTVVEQDVNTNTSPFFPRFIEAYNYYSAVFESLDVTLPRQSQDRMNVERQCLARDIVNIVACEGEERIERYEVAGKWRSRLTMAGFSSCPIGSGVADVIREMIKEQYCDRYKVKEEQGALHFGFEDKSLIVASAWK